jgi:radical SAM superfamily enzyme YgiQ (UPF0313 family)
MKKICLVYPDEMKLPDYFRYATNISTDISETLPPMGLLYIIGNSKYEIDLIDNRIKNYSFEELSKVLMQYDTVGFGGTIFEIKQARQLSKYLLTKGKTTFYGGPNATVNWNLYLGCFSVIFRGEAELVFDSVVDNIDDLEHLGFTRIGGSYVNSQPFRIENLDNLNLPDRSKINLDDYRRQEPAYLSDVQPVDVVVTSRGCPFDCYFCSSKVIWNQRYTYRAVDNVIKEIQFMIDEYGTKGIYFREDNFTTNTKHLLEFCEKIKDFKLAWLCESRVDTLNEEIVKSMAQAGCKGIWFGLESTDNEVLKKIRKNTTLAQMKNAIDFCKQYGITTGGGFMLGFPFDDRESIIRNHSSSKKLNLNICFYNRVWAIPVSDMHSQIINEGLDYYCFENIILPATRYLSADELNKLYYKLVSKKTIYGKKIARIFGKRTILYIQKKFTSIYRIVLKILRL